MHHCARGRFYSVVDLVNRLENEACAGRQGQLADYLTRLDFVVLDELGYLPFTQTGGLLPSPRGFLPVWLHPFRGCADLRGWRSRRCAACRAWCAPQPRRQLAARRRAIRRGPIHPFRRSRDCRLARAGPRQKSRGSAARRLRSVETPTHPTEFEHPGVPYTTLHGLSHALMAEIALECGYRRAR
jgi:hypothetical protein